MIIWIAALPGIIYLQDAEPQPIPFLPFVGIYYILFFGLPVFLKPLAYHFGDAVAVHAVVVLAPTRSVVILLAMTGIAALVAGFYLAKYTLLSRMSHFRMPALRLQAMELNILYGFLLIGSLAFRFSPTIQSLPSIGQFLGPVGYLAFGGFYLQWRAGRLPGYLSLTALLIGVPLELFWRIKNLFITDLLLLLVFFILILWRERQFRFLTVLMVICVLLVPTYSATVAVRGSADTAAGRLVVAGKRIVETLRAPADIENEARGRMIRYNPLITPLVDRIGQIWFSRWCTIEVRTQCHFGVEKATNRFSRRSYRAPFTPPNRRNAPAASLAAATEFCREIVQGHR